jgi:uncharacterized membrane protein
MTMNTNDIVNEDFDSNSSRCHSEAERRRESHNQRWIAMLLGSGLILGATARRSLPLALAGGMLVYRGATGRWAFSELLGLAGSEARHPSTSVPHETGIKVERSIVIYKSPEELYRFWRNLENLPRFMTQHVEIRQLDENRSHWKVNTLAGATFEWDAEIINEIPNELLAWRSLENSQLDHAGSVHFESGQSGGSKVTVIMQYRPLAGKLGAEIARMFGQEPAQVIEKDLHRLKQLMESGEITSAEAQPHGAGA